MTPKYIKRFFQLACVLLATGILAGVPVQHSKAQPINSISSAEALQIVSEFIVRESRLIPEWQGAIPLQPQPHYDLTGNIAAYIVSLENHGQDVGYVAVSGEMLPNPILEFSKQPARYKAVKQIQTTAANLGITVDTQKPLYLGMLAYFYPVQNNDLLRLVEMGSQRIVSIPDILTSTLARSVISEPIPFSNTLQVSVASPDSTLSAVRKILFGPDYSWYRGCGPTAVGNVMGYWADRGYPGLVYGGSNRDYTGTIDQLADLMGTSSQGWTWLPINDDIKRFAVMRGYIFGSQEITTPTFDRLRDEIDSHRPTTVLVNGHVKYGDHFITMFGYEFEPNNSNYKYMMVHDTWGDGDYWVQYGVGYSQMWADTTVPPAIQIDSTAPTSAVTPLAEYQVSEYFPVSWSGYDTGWGLGGYDIQYRDGTLGDWTTWITHTTSTSGMFSGLKGHHYYFRSSAYDIDHNEEEYPGGDGDAHTLVAQYVLAGMVMTNRGIPVMGASVSTSPPSIGPARSDGDGIYRLGLATSGSYTITISGNSNFGELPPLSLVNVLNDINLPSVILPPMPNLISNGNFESGISSWSISGPVSPTITTAALTGNNAALLGWNPPSQGGYSALAQTITIPMTIERPTLSLVYQAISLWNPDPLIVTLSAGTTLATYTLPLDTTEWRDAWIDLGTFKGQVVQITLEIQNSTISYPNTVRLDDISLGPASPGVVKVHLPTIMSRP